MKVYTYEELMVIVKELEYNFVATYISSGTTIVGDKEIPYEPCWIVGDNYTRFYKHSNPDKKFLKSFVSNPDYLVAMTKAVNEIRGEE